MRRWSEVSFIEKLDVAAGLRACRSLGHFKKRHCHEKARKGAKNPGLAFCLM
jgi:hypothetical protein